jgi:hypothetical protein
MTGRFGSGVHPELRRWREPSIGALQPQSAHPGLDLRLRDLEARIARSHRFMTTAQGADRIERVGELVELRRHYAALGRRVQALDRIEPGWWQMIRTALERAADDMTGLLGEFATSLDAPPHHPLPSSPRLLPPVASRTLRDR